MNCCNWKLLKLDTFVPSKTGFCLTCHGCPGSCLGIINNMYSKIGKIIVFGALLCICGTAYSQESDSLSFSLEEMICGRTSGVQINAMDYSPSSSYNIFIRGVKALRGSNEPLIVLDGVPLQRQSRGTLRTFLDDDSDWQLQQNALYVINPQDIESIEILKDAAAAAIYGGEGSSGGVIKITTRKGGERGKSNVFWKSDVGVSMVARPGSYKMLGGDSYRRYIEAVSPSSSILSSEWTPADWQKEAYGVAVSHRHYISAGGESRSTNYFLSALFEDRNGVIKRSGDTRGAFRLNFSNKLGKVGEMGIRSVFSLSSVDMVRSSTMLGTSGTMDRILSGRPIMTSTDFASRTEGIQNDLIAENFYSWRDDYDDHSKKYRVYTSLYVNLDLAKNLKWENTFGIDYYDEDRRRWLGNMTEQGYEKNSMVGISTYKGMKYFGESHFKYMTVIDNAHKIGARLGASVSGEQFQDNVAEGYSFTFKYLRGLKDAELFPDGKGGVRTTPLYNLYDTRALLMAADAGIFYNCKGKYDLSVFLRSDMIAHYVNNDNVCWYPSASFSWNILKEGWGLEDVFSGFSLNLKYGRSGTNRTDLYRNLPYYMPDTITLPEGIETGNTLKHSVLWSLINEEYSASLDFGLCDNRVNISVGYYYSKAKDRLGIYNRGYSGKAELIPETLSTADVRNSGVELSVFSEIIKARDFSWNAELNLSYNNNVIKDNGYWNNLYYGNSVGSMGSNESQLRINAFAKGNPVGAIYGYRTAGIASAENMAYAPAFNETRLQEGDIMFVDYDGDMNVTEEDMTMLGNSIPKYLCNLNITFAYRRWSLDLNLEGMFDYDLVNLNRMSQEYFVTGNLDNIGYDRFNSWLSGTDAVSRGPRLDAVGQDVISDRFVEDASFLRLSRLRISYSQPLKARWIKDINFAITAYNLFTVTGYSGFDPAVNSFGGDISRYGADSRAYPSSRMFAVSVFANF